nr:MAG TPA: hypothetical protein [Caudoviricetes sp.]
MHIYRLYGIIVSVYITYSYIHSNPHNYWYTKGISLYKLSNS